MRARVLLLAALLAAPAALAAPSRSGVSALLVGLSAGPGFGLSGGPAWFKLQGRVGVELAPLDARLAVAVLLPITLDLQGGDDTYGEVNSVGVEITPGGRLLVQLVPKLRLYFDVGLGLATYQATVRLPFFGERTGSATGFAFRTALGLEFQVVDAVRIVVEPFSLLVQTTQGARYDNAIIGRTPGHQLSLFFGVDFAL